MSDPLRVALAVEGKTDLVVLEAAIRHLLNGRDFIPTQLQPQSSALLSLSSSVTPEGWPGVYKWCEQTKDAGAEGFSGNILFKNHDVLVVQLDADVAESTYASGHIKDNSNDLPCEVDCPPAVGTTNALRKVLLRWMGEVSTPSKTVLCTPSKSLEAWVLVAIYPEDKFVKSGGIECRKKPEALLKSKPSSGRLISGNKKKPENYQKISSKFEARWPEVRSACTEAERFSMDFLKLI